MFMNSEEKKALIKGVVERVVNLPTKQLVMLTIGARETSVNGQAYQLGERITFKISYSDIKELSRMEILNSIAIGDWVLISAQRGPKGIWFLTDISYEPTLGRDASDWLNDVVKSFSRYNH